VKEYPECPRPFDYHIKDRTLAIGTKLHEQMAANFYTGGDVRRLMDRRRRARRQQRWAIALCLIGAALIILLEVIGWP
jgi:hypothetical protein